MVDNGVHVPTWGGRRAQRALARVKAAARRANAPCCLCDREIDYTLEYPHPKSCSVQHVKARSLHPELTWDPANWLPCHLQCNKRAGTGQPAPIESESDWPTSGW